MAEESRHDAELIDRRVTLSGFYHYLVVYVVAASNEKCFSFVLRPFRYFHDTKRERKRKRDSERER